MPKHGPMLLYVHRHSRKFSRRSCRYSDLRPFNHESGALTTELSRSPMHEHTFLITLWNRIEYVTGSHEMSLNLKFGNWRYLHVSNLHFLLVILIFTEVARKRPWSFCQKCMVVWCTQNLTGRDGSSFMWHQPCQRSKCTTSVDIQKCAIKS